MRVLRPERPRLGVPELLDLAVAHGVGTAAREGEPEGPGPFHDFWGGALLRLQRSGAPHEVDVLALVRGQGVVERLQPLLVARRQQAFQCERRVSQKRRVDVGRQRSRDGVPVVAAAQAVVDGFSYLEDALLLPLGADAHGCGAPFGERLRTARGQVAARSSGRGRERSLSMLRRVELAERELLAGRGAKTRGWWWLLVPTTHSSHRQSYQSLHPLQEKLS
mmetsp:Transcript_9816/g.29347  ORF Transcript_9816/g.29347 Transcript_9816/m.29347 type:complete len:221 (-) Transcript_9816:137-799(-)